MDPENFKWPPVISGPGGAVLEPGGRGVTPRGCRQGGRRGFFLNPTRPVQGGAGSRRDPGAPVEGRWPAAQAGQGSDRGPLPGLQGQHSVGWEQSLPRPSIQPPEKGASVPGLLETGGKERREKPAARQQVPCQTLPGCRRPHTRPGRPQKVVSLPPPFKSGARSLPRHQGVTGRVRQPQISPRSAPVPVPPAGPPPPRRRWALAGPRCRRLRSQAVHGERGNGVLQRQQSRAGFYHAGSTLLLRVISIQPTGRMSVSV